MSKPLETSLQGHLGGWLGISIPMGQLLAAIGASIVAYCVAKVIYRFYFHPLSKYPGPKLAAATDLWWAYASITGRYPWIIEDTLKRYGDIVRIAPNELVFGNPQAARDIYLPHVKNMELFVQPGYDTLDTGDGGITWETNPAKHREIAKKLAPAFSTKNFRAKEATVQKHVDLFIKRLIEVGAQQRGVDLRLWTEWLALDLAADMTYSQDMGHVRNAKSSEFLDTALKLNFFGAVTNIAAKFRFLTPFIYLCIPPSVWLSMPRLIKMNSEDVKIRISRRGKTEHLDYFEQLAPADKPEPKDKKQIFHLQNIAGQLLLAGWQPMSHQSYSVICQLLKNPRVYATLVEEVRSTFKDSNEISTDTTATLKYLQACINESLRMHPDTVDGLPRISPGAVVDGKFIPKGVICQHSHFAAARSPRFFAEPLEFHPERWLAPDHPCFDQKFKDDNLKASMPFNQGTRACTGSSIALAVLRLFLAKVLMHFDLEAVPGQDEVLFDEHYKYLAFWERPPFRVRFKRVDDTSTPEHGKLNHV